MRIFVTGIAGFIGSHVADTLLDMTNHVYGFDNYSTGKTENNSPRGALVLTKGDITNKRELFELFSEFKPHSVIHLAAQSAITTSLSDPILDIQVNGIGTLNVVQAALEFGVDRFVFASTSAVYQDRGMAQFSAIKEGYFLGPSNPYGISKLAAEGYIRTMFPNSTILRFGNVYGPRQTPLGENQVIARMIRHFEFGDEFYIHGSGNQRRDFVYVSDVVDAVVASLEGEPGTYNISTAQATSVNMIEDMVRFRYGYDNAELALHTDKEDPRPYVCMDNSLAKEGLGWEPKVEIYDGVNRTIDWWKEQGKK